MRSPLVEDTEAVARSNVGKVTNKRSKSTINLSGISKGNESPARTSIIMKRNSCSEEDGTEAVTSFNVEKVKKTSKSTITQCRTRKASSSLATNSTKLVRGSMSKTIGTGRTSCNVRSRKK